MLNYERPASPQSGRYTYYLRLLVIMRSTARTLQKALDNLHISEHLSSINKLEPAGSWELISKSGSVGVESSLESNYKFRNFAKTWQFLNGVAQLAHSQKHHPTVTTTYNKVNLSITTHDAGNQVTRKDLKLAQQIQNLYVEQAEKSPVKDKKTSTLLQDARSMVDQKKAAEVIDKLTKR